MTSATEHQDLLGKVRIFRGWLLQPGRSVLAIALSSLLVAACVATGSQASSAGGSTSATAAGASPLSSADVPARPEASGNASALTPGPSSPPGAILETATAGPNPIGAGQGSSGKAVNPLTICIGPDQGPPCVPSDEVAIVVAAQGALSSETRSLIETATVLLIDSCPAGAPAAACGTSDAPVATVRFDRQGGSLLGTVYVYRSTTGGLEGALLP